MGLRFVVEDDFHSDTVGTFASREEALAFVRRLGSDPEADENRPPCMSWRTCRREYHLLECDDSTLPWTLLDSRALFALDFPSGEVSLIPLPRALQEEWWPVYIRFREDGFTRPRLRSFAPIQIEGRLPDGQAFSLRERRGKWYLGLGGTDPVASPNWSTTDLAPSGFVRLIDAYDAVTRLLRRR